MDYSLVLILLASNSSLLLALLGILGILSARWRRVYVIDSQEKIILLDKKVWSLMVKDDQALGVCFGWWFVGYIKSSTDSHGQTRGTAYMWCTLKKYSEFTSGLNLENRTKDWKLWERDGCSFDITYSTRAVPFTSKLKRPKPGQHGIMEEVISVYRRQNYVVVLLSGKPGSGKSAIGKLLCKKLDGSYCKTYNPTTAGDSFRKLYLAAAPSKESPLIVALEEIDEILCEVKHKKVAVNKYCPAQIHRKSDWNNFLDDIDDGLYPNVIMIMTTNMTIDDLRTLDDSLIRENRINVIKEL